MGKKQKGVTLLEILIVMALLAILLILLFVGWQLQLEKARDAERAAELEIWAKALITYQDDKGCFPEEEELSCGSNFLDPYLPEIPCDPVGRDEYQYVYSKVDCNTFYIYGNLENEASEKILQVGCSGGCGPDSESEDYNYFVSSTNVSVESEVGGLPPTCGGAVKYCFPGVCSTCCPGVAMRCAPSGQLCLTDTSCVQ